VTFDGTIFTAVCSVAVALISFASASGVRRRPRPADPEPAPPAVAGLPAGATNVYPHVLGLYEAELARVETATAGLRDRLAQIAQIAGKPPEPTEGQPRMPRAGQDRRHGRRQARRVRWGDMFTAAEEEAGEVELEGPDHTTPEPPPADQVVGEEETEGEYA
jgi:hypothetical protein